jgi:type VI protein secretion system component VasK
MIILGYGWQWHLDWTPIIIGLIVLLILAYFLLFPILVAKAARNRGRSGALWFLLSLLISPVLTVLLLLAMGDTDAKRKERWAHEEQIRNRMQNRQTTAASHEDNEQLRHLLEQSRRS